MNVQEDSAIRNNYSRNGRSIIFTVLVEEINPQLNAGRTTEETSAAGATSLMCEVCWSEKTNRLTRDQTNMEMLFIHKSFTRVGTDLRGPVND